MVTYDEVMLVLAVLSTAATIIGVIITIIKNKPLPRQGKRLK